MKNARPRVTQGTIGESSVEVTLNHDYYRRVCVAVLDKRTGAFLVDPAAFRRRADAVAARAASAIDWEDGDRCVYVTKNHEYYCRDGVCVAVLDPRTDTFLARHGAIGRHAHGAVNFDAAGYGSVCPADTARPGALLHFATGAQDPHSVVTSPLVAIRRPFRAAASFDRH